MIQRIQTVYLLLAAAGNVALALMPWKIVPRATEAGIFADGMFRAADHPALQPALGAAALLALIAVGLYKKRPLQIRLSWLSLALTMGAAAWAAWLWNANPAQGTLTVGLLTLPLVAVFIFLAVRGIAKDEQKVRTANRLR